MSKLTMSLAAVASFLGAGLIALPALANAASAPALPGALTVIDSAKVFSTEAITQAQKEMSDTKFDHGLHFTVDTYEKIPADMKGYSKEKADEFFENWAKSVVRSDKDKGPYVLICIEPGYTKVLVDKESR
ncbi:MAG TPA: hypothetical protein VG097_12090, partial [Gemmata sp.]|nr:hypothetical protein [Gemmata sp.]